MRFVALSILALLVMSAGVFHVQAQKNAKDNPAQKAPEKPEQKTDKKPEAKPLDEKELQTAERLRLKLGPQNAALVNSLRYLIRPEFELDLMAGRRHRPCVLDPFETRATGSPDNLQLMRLLAVLKTGTPASETVDNHTRHFLDSTVEGTNLARLGLEMQILLAAKAHPGIAWDDDLKTRAQTIFDKAAKLRVETTIKSPLVQNGEVMPARWFANHLWRAVIYAGAIKFELEELPNKVLAEDLRLLMRTYIKRRGWVATRKRADKDHPEISNELNCNLLAMATFQLAHATPEGFLSRGLRNDLKKALSKAPKILSKLNEDFDEQGFTSGRLLLALSLGELAPDRNTAEAWRDGLREFSCALVDPTGEIPPTTNIARELGLDEPSWRRGHASTAETALFLVGLSGGLMPDAEPPLVNENVNKLGQAMYSMALLHADQAAPSGEDFQADVNYALKTGVEYLASIQSENGTWPGSYTAHSGNTALCMLAMLHGGWKRDSLQIKSGLKALDQQTSKDWVMTYDAACILMFFQKYYEKEQREAGVLSSRTAKEFSKARNAVQRKIKSDHHALMERLTKLLDSAGIGGNKGGYGYYPVKGSEKGPFGVGHSDNSCSQYVMLGYKSASLLGFKVNHNVFAAEAMRLISQYGGMQSMEHVEYEAPDEDDGKTTSRGKKAKIQPGGWGYMTTKTTAPSMQMTAAGLSSLSVCRDELEIRGKLKADLRFKIGLHIRGALAYLASAYYKADQFEARNILTTNSRDGWGAFYNLYSVERGCVLAGARKLDGDIDWYRIGAQGLIDAQKWEGGWGYTAASRNGRALRPHTVNTCMAILFLKKASLPVLTGPKRKPKKDNTEDPDPKPKEDGPITGK
ncbi:MAG: hypothetical protein ACYTDT_02020 [Planctomycetota bacterium]|jgi:hypothetical protein